MESTKTIRGRGRPTVPENDRKRPRNVSVSDTAWEGLEKQAKLLGAKTVSELVEKIGLQQLQVVERDLSPLADIPIYRRLMGLISEPVAVFWSVLAFVGRTCQQFSLEPTSESIYSVVVKACAIAFYIGYTHPDVLINNPSALLRWLCYRIVQAAAQQQETLPTDDKSFAITEEEVKTRLQKISDAFRVLEVAARSPEYEALKMKTMDGLTIKQISRIFKLQDLQVDKAEVSTMIKRGLAQFRKLLYGKSDSHLTSVQPSTTSQALPETAQNYLRLALQMSLQDEQSQQSMEAILLRTSHDPLLDFWLNEIDFDLSSGQYSQVRNRIAKELGDYLQQKKAEIDPELTFCSTREQIRQILQGYACREAGTDLLVEILLGERIESA
jgi:hypothetical protein